MQRSDLLIALGSRFDDRVTGRVAAFAPDAKVIHVDIDPAELHKVRRADVAIAGDCRLVIEEMLLALDSLGLAHSEATRGGRGGSPSDAVPGRSRRPGSVAARFPRERLAPWRAAAGRGRSGSRWSTTSSPGPGPSSPSSSSRSCATAAPRTPSSPPGWASTRCWPRQYWQFDHPYTWVNSGRPRHDGLRRARGHRRQGGPARQDGVGRRRRRLLPDDRPGAGHRQLGADPGQDRHPQQRLPRHGPPVAGDVLRGALLRGLPVARPARLRRSGPRPWAAWASGSSRPRTWPPAIDKANSIDDRPVVIDFRTDAFEKVFPMVAAGASNDDIMVRPRR